MSKKTFDSFETGEILEAARSIRPYLGQLVPDEATASELDHRLAEILTPDGDEEGARDLVEELLERDEVRDWTRAFLVREGLKVFRDYRPPAGLPVPPPSAARYVCPRGDFTWHRLFVGQPVPLCPTHQVPLDRA